MFYLNRLHVCCMCKTLNIDMLSFTIFCDICHMLWSLYCQCQVNGRSGQLGPTARNPAVTGRALAAEPAQCRALATEGATVPDTAWKQGSAKFENAQVIYHYR